MNTGTSTHPTPSREATLCGWCGVYRGSMWSGLAVAILTLLACQPNHSTEPRPAHGNTATPQTARQGQVARLSPPIGQLFAGDGGPSTEGVLRLPSAVAVSEQGDVFIADSGHRRIRVVT